MRLVALGDSPDSFGASLDVERGYDEATWRSRMQPGKGVQVVAFNDQPVGIVGGYLPEDDADLVELISMWVMPSARGRRIAELLVDDVLRWARELGRPTVGLFVTEGNEPARRLFERIGFSANGEREVLESNPKLYCNRMICDPRTRQQPD
ncbi:GNAT family N-acetyltransferase [Acrocarpospora macrocephala]